MIYQQFGQHINSPRLAEVECMSALYGLVRTPPADPRWISKADAELAHDKMRADAQAGQINFWDTDALTSEVLAVLGESVDLNLQRAHVGVVHSADAYYLALVRVLQRELGARVILATSDSPLWRSATALGIEVFHTRTCDLGQGAGIKGVGNPGHAVAGGTNCSPCGHSSCPSSFVVDLVGLPPGLETSTV